MKNLDFFARVRDWKGYGIWYKCGTCEPLQSPTDVALEMSGSAELCRERPNENSRTKYYDSSHADEQDARHPEELVPRREKKEGCPSRFTSSAGSDCAVFYPVRGLQAP